ncbi:hypothetical protein [Parabacteroides sp. FAFU027]|uniref:hypothetical protein n=1 Tax=Parabacteroides sp. FAFU027 TaxID=2922715 RepID=UPI001FAFE6E6|nr:hypothetical protein [Parabacteroides sp. FAFU027]
MNSNVLFKSRIINEFSGWVANTWFVFENGQVWKKMDYDIYYTNKSFPIGSVIDDDGYTYLEVDGHRTLVRRIK